MAAWDQHKNFAGTTVATAPTPATSGTALVVVDGTVFPTVPFNASIFPSGTTPSPSNAEVVRVTNISTNTLTIVRTQESSSARSIVAGDIIVAAITKKTITDIEGALSGTTGYTLIAQGTGNLPALVANGAPVVVTLTDGASVSLDSSQGTVFRLAAGGDRTILTPTAATNGQKIIIQHFASGGNRTLTLTTGSTNAFRFGSDITGLTATASGKTDYIGCIFNSTDSRWDVVAVTKGF